MRSLSKVSDISVLRTWISKLSKELGVKLCYTTHLMERLYKHTSVVASKVKKLRQQGDHQKKKHLQEE